MKTIVSIILLVGTVCLSACKEQSIDEPIVIRLYFSFVTEEGGDFFASDERYDVSKVAFGCQSDNYRFTVDNVSVFERSSSSCESIIDFGNGDMDTLKVEWLPDDYTGGDIDAEKLEKVIFTYNGIVVETWNFNPDLQFFRELVDRNAIKFDDVRSGNPIVIKLPKSADENELN